MATKFPPCGCFMHRVFLGLVAPYNDSCPVICGSDLFIIGISNNYTVDGWYLEQEASNIVYMESGAIIETVPCDTGLANYGHANGRSYEYPHYFNGGQWVYLINVTQELVSGTEYNLTVELDTTYNWGVASGVLQYSIDNGATYIDIGTFEYSPSSLPPYLFTFDEGTNDFILRAIVTLENGCQFFNPAPDGSNAPVTYFILDDQFLSQFTGWTFDGTDLLDFRDNILPTLPNFLYDSSIDTAGDSLYVAFSGVTHPDIIVVDSATDPVVLDWVTLIAKIPCLSATFTVVDPTDTTIQYLMIGSKVITASALPVTNPLCATEIQSLMVGNGFGSLTTVEINVAGNDVTITFRNSNGLVTGIRWLDSAMNTGDETLSPC